MSAPILKPSRFPPLAVWAAAILVPAASFFPTWQAHLVESPPDRISMGFRFMANDHYQYAAFIRQAQDNATFFMDNPFTSESQTGVFVLIYFWLIGIITAATGAAVTTVWEAFRLLGGILYILIFWIFSASFVQDRRQRTAATILFACAGGLDWIVELPLLLFVNERHVLVGLPFDHFWNWSTFGTMVAANWLWPAMLMLLTGHLLLLRRRCLGLSAVLLLPLIWFVHPYTAMVAYLTLALTPAMPVLVAAARLEPIIWHDARANLVAVWPGVASFLMVAAYLLWARQDDVFRAASDNGFTWNPVYAVWWYPLTYGLLLPLAFFGIKQSACKRTLGTDLIFAWIVSAFLLSTNPFFAGQKFQYLLFPPLALMAAVGLFYLLDHSSAVARLSKSMAARLVLAVLLFANAPMALIRYMPQTSDETDTFMSKSELDAMAWMDTQPDGLVLCGLRTGNVIPWLTGKKVYLGHWFLTLEIGEKTKRMHAFFDPDTPALQKRQLLQQSTAGYIYIGPDENQLMQRGRTVTSSRDTPLDYLPLDKVYDANEISIYKVIEKP